MDQLSSWLAQLGLERYARAFADNEVDLDTIRLLTEQDLERLGLPLGPRRKLLSALGLDSYTLGISGGIVLFLIALGMVFPARRVMESEGLDDPLVVPIAMPLIAGPGAISIVTVLAEKNPLLTVVGAVTIAAGAGAAILTLSPTLFTVLGRRGALALERLMGILLVMLAVQMILDGLAAYLAAR